MPGCSPLAVTLTGSPGPCGELPIPALLESTQVIVELVTPETSDVAVIVRSVSGVSVKLTPAGVPLEQLAAVVGVAVFEVVSIA